MGKSVQGKEERGFGSARFEKGEP
jgi:hypothetical protein